MYFDQVHFFDVNDSKSVTGGSCVFYAALFVLFVIICCQMFYFDHFCFLYVIDSKFWHWRFLRLRRCFIYVFYLNCHYYLMFKGFGLIMFGLF